MLRLAADENFRGPMLRALVQRQPALDVVRVQDTGIAGAGDPQLLDWAAKQGRVLLSHDRTTLAGFAYDRVARGLPMAGLIVVAQGAATGTAVEDILIVAESMRQDEIDGQVLFVPL